jgi:hypothetical protein
MVKRASGLEQISDFRFPISDLSGRRSPPGRRLADLIIDVRLTIPGVYPKNFVVRSVIQTLRAIDGLGKNQPVS